MLGRLFEIPSSPEELIRFIVSCIVALCVTAVLCAVAMNFLSASESGQVKREKRSPVATGTMILFFFAFYLLVHRRIGVVEVENMSALITISIIGLIMVIVGAIVNILGRVNLGKNWANQVTLYSKQTLVTKGMFGVVRHPLYASLIWMFCGASIVYHNYAAFLAATMVFMPAMYFRAKQEEAMLEVQFPDYNNYRKRVGMFFPKLWRSK
jgi:protein-S-isoprenylcysteine O-methyltransferase Ste14